MGSKTVMFQIRTNKSLAEVKDAVKRSLMMLGGTMMEGGDMIQVNQGVNGVSMAFTTKMEAFVSVRQSGEGTYDLMANINWKPSDLVWICFGVGFFVFGILWVVPLLYFFVDPTSAYQQALYTAQAQLG